MQHPKITRVNPNQLEIQHPSRTPIQLFANQHVPLERSAFQELSQLLELTETLERHYCADPDGFEQKPQLERVALTPDFHKGSGVPVGTVLQTRGFVLPQAIGNDVGCGMRLHLTDFSFEQLEPHLDCLEGHLRHSFFKGGRDIPMTGIQRQSLLEGGIAGLASSVPRSQDEGLWQLWQGRNLELDMQHTEGQHSSFPLTKNLGLEDFLGEAHSLSRDAQIGSIGGGNHFVELQQVTQILEPATAHAWGLRLGMVVVMVHSGSLGLGHLCGSNLRQMVRTLFPKSLEHPKNGFFPLPIGEKYHNQLERCTHLLGHAAHFASVNRLFLALMVQQTLLERVGDTDFPLLYDAAHNMIWQDHTGTHLHRKGATPARGLEAMLKIRQDTPFAYYGEPVLVPGSMGASSFILAGQGHPEALESASHGAGRSRSRGAAMRGFEAEFAQFLQDFRVVTPLDWKNARADIKAKKLLELRQEAPFAYKGIGPVIETLASAGLARGVAELKPILTVKG